MDETTTRRAGLGSGLKLAFTAPAVLAALPLGVAAADSETGKQRGRGRDNLPSPAAAAVAQAQAHGPSSTPFTSTHPRRHVSFVAALVSARDVDSSDFAPNANADTGDGRLRVISSSGESNGRVQLKLRSSAKNTTYDVVFRALNGSDSTLGQITTDGDGRFNGRLTNPLPGKNRAGVFLLRRQGSADVQFLSVAHGKDFA